MQTSHRLVKRDLSGGTPLPKAYKDLPPLRRGSVHMVCGTPGTMKSMLVLNMVYRMKSTTLYCSTDSDSFTQNSRQLAISTGTPTADTELMMVEETDYCSSILQDEWDFVAWNYLPAPELDDIWLEADAYLEVWGAYPELTVIDIASDIEFQDGDEFATLRQLMREMKKYARDTESAVLVVHHTTEAVPGHPCQPRSAVMGKISAIPVLILTTGLQGPQLGVATVKNRFGRGKADGSLYTLLDADGDRCTISEPTPPEWTPWSAAE